MRIEKGIKNLNIKLQRVEAKKDNKIQGINAILNKLQGIEYKTEEMKLS